MNIEKAKQNMRICDIISTVYLVLTGAIGVYLIYLLVGCANGMALFITGIENVDPDSAIAGYSVLGSLIGAGAAGVLYLVLAGLLILAIVFFILVLLQRLGGWLYAKKPNELRYLKKNVLLKTIPAFIVHCFMVSLLYDNLSNFPLVLPFLGESVILYFCVQTYSFLNRQVHYGSSDL